LTVADQLKPAERLQSVLDPASAAAESIHELGLVLYAGATLIFLLVLGLTLFGAFTRAREVAASTWVIGGGVIFPTVALAALLIYEIHIGNALSAAAPRPAEIEVTGKLWWWEVRYNYRKDGGNGSHAVLANELYLPVGRPVEIALTTDNVIHSFWIPALAGKVDMIPGRTNRLVLEARAPGVYRGQCAEYCGVQHAWMAFYVVAVSEEAYGAWLASQAAPARETIDAFELRGRDAFLREGCGNCHTIRGTSANGTAGPDLTHVGSRRSLAAGRLDNHAGTLAGWIADSQRIKPGNLMPSISTLSGEDLRAIAAYLEGLK
jgi:cytochrome c oxidase subunit II